MFKKFSFLLSLLLFVVGTTMSWADFTDFKVILSNAEGTLITADEISKQSAVEFGYVVASDGTVTRVSKDDAASMGTIKGTYHSEHGLTNFEMTVKVDGGVKVGMGTCNWGGNVTINGTTAFTTFVSGKCWHNDKVNYIAYGHYVGEAGTITIKGGGYTPYVSIEAESVKSNAVTFSKGTVECEGTLLPEGKDVIAGESFAIPANYTLYKEGYTLTGWTDGKNTYNTGSSFVPTEDVTLTPVFTQNTKTLADRTDAVTIKWNFRKDQGAPVLKYEGQEGLIYVAQATVAGEVIDVKMDFSTKPGKVNNASNNDWAQVTKGTKFTIPSCKGAVVSMEAYDNITTTTIDGQSDYTQGKTISYTTANKAETIDIVIGDGSYYRYIQVVLPVVEATGSKTYTNQEASVKWAFNSATEYETSVKAPEDAFQTTSFDLGTATISGTGTSTQVSGVTFVKVKATTGATDLISWNVKPVAGLTFTPTRVRGYINRGATDIASGVKISLKAGDNAAVVLGTYTAARYNKTKDADAKGSESDYANEFDITLSADQQSAFATTDMLSLISTIGVGSGREGFFSGIEIYGTVSGTLADVNKYTVNVAASPADGGSATIYPKSDEYVENDEVTLTATENFGYNFVNWTNAAGEEVSKEAKYKTTVTANETYTANFKKVNTYELAVNVSGGANDYMVSLNPAPVVVEGKKMYEEGTKVTLTASENKILTFNSWSDGQTEKVIVYTMDGDKNVTADFSAIDFIVGWDFYKSGNNSRIADFFAAENDDVTLNMHKADGTITSWLDKSQVAAGGYEGGRPGAVCWVQGTTNGDVGNCYWQTKVNAEAFSDIKIVTSMLYNYNCYLTYDIMVSTDGEAWEKAGSITMGEAKAWADKTIELAAKYSNQKNLYIRWIADKTSEKKGSASQNDGACLGATYIIATAKLVDDGTAPVLVKTVPAEGADNASANGKIVLTFDEKVKTAENAKGAINGVQLTPVVSGKTVSFEYKSLEYSTAYTFTLPANSVADLTDNYITTPITINFQTKQKPSIEKGMYDVIVHNGEEMKAAIAQANTRADKTKRFRIFVMPGSHKIPTYDTKVTVTVTLADKSKAERTYDEPRTYITADNISIIGADYETTTITNSTPTETYEGEYGEANISEGIGNNDVFQISGKNTYFQGVTVKTGIGDARGRDLAIHDKGDKTIFKEARLWGYQDTYTNNNGSGRTYFEGGVIRGRTDYLCGKADIWFEGVTLQQCGKGGYPIVPSSPKKFGWIFNGCTLKPETSDVTCTLGRPWGSGTPIALLINTTMEVVPGAEGWSEMSGGWPKRFAEYNSVTKTGTVIDLSKRKKTFGNAEKGIHENCNNPILTAAEASEYSIAKVMGDGDDWDPTALTEQASAPQNVLIDGTSLTWNNSNYVLCWAVIKNGDIVEFTTTPSYTVDDATATWSVRAANEMGGLGEATVATTTAIKDAPATAKSTDGKYAKNGQVIIKKRNNTYNVGGVIIK